MSARKVDMHRLQEFVRLFRLDTSSREIAQLLGLGRNTQRRYRKLFKQAGLLSGSVADLPELAALRALVKAEMPAVVPPQQQSRIGEWEEVVGKLLERGAGPTAIYDKLRTDQPDFPGSLGAVKRLCVRLKGKRGPRPTDVAIPVISPAGEIAQVDFGYAGRLRDPETGDTKRAWVFVLVLGYSRHMFARIVFDQAAETWQRLHVEAFTTFGGAVATVVPDNLKAAVVRASFTVDEPSGIQRGYRDLARHYGFRIDPTPVRDPKKKGKVESGVKYVKGNFLAARTFSDIQDANRQLDAWVRDIAGRRRHGTTGWAPLAVFEAEERPALLPLPPHPFEPVRWHELKVGQDAHVVVGRRMYSVPWVLLGQQVWARATAASVVIYHQDERVATHARRGEGHRSTQEAHMPAYRVAWRHRSPAHWHAAAAEMGPGVEAFVQAVFDADAVASPLKVVQTVFSRLREVSPARANAACHRALHFGALTAGAVRRILDEGLEDEARSGLWVAPASGEPSPRFARDMSEVLARAGGRS